jgi:hypothetical protein
VQKNQSIATRETFLSIFSSRTRLVALSAQILAELQKSQKKKRSVVAHWVSGCT